MNNGNNKSKEVLYHYSSFVLKSATLVMLLPVAEIFASPFELKLTAILLNMMYLILAVEFGFSIQISRVVGDHTDENGIRNNIEKISNISSRVCTLETQQMGLPVVKKDVFHMYVLIKFLS